MYHTPNLNTQTTFGEETKLWIKSIPSSCHKYIREVNGHLKYHVEIDTQGVKKDCISVKANHDIVTISAKHKQISKEGDVCTHELHRELHLPSNVQSSTLRCTFVEPTTLVMEADVLNISNPTGPSMNEVKSPHQMAHSGFVPMKPRMPSDSRRVKFLEPTGPSVMYPHETDAIRVFDSERRGETTISDRKSRQPNRSLLPSLSNERTSIPSSFLTSSHFTLNIELDREISPADVKVRRTDDILIVHARRLASGQEFDHTSSKRGQRTVFEHRSEHTLPNTICLPRLTARLQDGVLHVDAPYLPLRSVRSPTPPSRMDSNIRHQLSRPMT